MRVGIPQGHVDGVDGATDVQAVGDQGGVATAGAGERDVGGRCGRGGVVGPGVTRKRAGETDGDEGHESGRGDPRMTRITTGRQGIHMLRPCTPPLVPVGGSRFSISIRQQAPQRSSAYVENINLPRRYATPLIFKVKLK